MDALAYLIDRYYLDIDVGRMPIEIPGVGRDDLAQWFAELGFKLGAEIGVECGLYTEMLCRENPQAMIYGIDPWQSYAGYREHVSQEKLNGFYQATHKRLVPYGNYKLIRKFSMEAVSDFADESLDFVYIDGNHELSFVVNDIIQWAKKVRRGGIVSGHDYRRDKRFINMKHVVYAVHAYADSYQIRPWFVLGRKNAPPGEKRDKNRSWMWVKR